MENIRKFKVGSNAFFSSFDDFEPHDTDILIIMDNPPKNKSYQHTKIRNIDFFIYKTMPKNEFIHFFITTKLPMRASIFLIPEVVELFGVTINDLELLQNVFYNMDDKHSYIKLIYDFYMQNNGIYLTEEQLKAVYEDYKSKRTKI